jgi:hypothetical protein
MVRRADRRAGGEVTMPHNTRSTAIPQFQMPLVAGRPPWPNDALGLLWAQLGLRERT